MITEQDLQEAIAECQGMRNPTVSTCIKLAALYTVKNELYGKNEQLQAYTMPSYSYSPGMEYESNSEFWERAKSMPANELFALLDELMDTLSITNPRLYNAFMMRLKT